MLKPVPLFGLGNQARSLNVNAQERTNLYVHVQQDAESGSTVSYMPMPGLLRWLDFGASPVRGWYQRNDVLYVVVSTTLWEVATNGTTTNRGTLNATTGRVDMVDNGDQLFIVDGSYGYIYTFATTTLAQITDVDFVAGNTCAFLNGYFLVQRADSGEFAISALYDGTSWAALDFATAETNPDNLQRIYALNGVIHLLGQRTTEFWGDSGATDFPFSRIGASGIQWGLASRWSLAEFMGSLMFLGRNPLGAVQVVMLSGTQAVPVSQDIDDILQDYTADNATGFAFTSQGHTFYQVNFPTDDVSWIYDGLTKVWHKAQYSTAGRHRAEMHITFNGTSYVSDYDNGKVYELDSDTYTDDGATIVREFVSRHQKTANFSKLPQLWIEMEAGVGLQSGQGSDPQVMLQISRDGGHTWGDEMWRGFGAAGEYRARAVWNRLGRARDWLFKVRVTDPVKTVFVGAWGRFSG